MTKFSLTERVRVVKAYHESVRRLIGRTGVVVGILEAHWIGYDLTIYTVLMDNGRPIALWSDELGKLDA